MECLNITHLFTNLIIIIIFQSGPDESIYVSAYTSELHFTSTYTLLVLITDKKAKNVTIYILSVYS